MAKPSTGKEFYRPLAVKDIGDRPLERHIEAKPAERYALAKRFGLLGLDSLDYANILLSCEKWIQTNIREDDVDWRSLDTIEALGAFLERQQK